MDLILINAHRERKVASFHTCAIGFATNIVLFTLKLKGGLIVATEIPSLSWLDFKIHLCRCQHDAERTVEFTESVPQYTETRKEFSGYG